MSTWYVPKPVTQRDPSDPQQFSQPTFWPGAVSAAPAMAHPFEGGTDMTQRTCSVDGCERPDLGARGMCYAHYRRVRLHGETMPHIPIGDTKRGLKTEEERFWEKVDATGDCWVWTAGKGAFGYGLFSSPRRSGSPSGNMPAHRWSWQELVGPIPAVDPVVVAAVFGIALVHGLWVELDRRALERDVRPTPDLGKALRS